MLDDDLATLYEVEVRVLNQAVKRNLDRFPDDFMFQLTAEEGFAFKVTNCDLKKWARAAPEVLAVRIYRAGSCDALQRSA